MKNKTKTICSTVINLSQNGVVLIIIGNTMAHAWIKIKTSFNTCHTHDLPQGHNRQTIMLSIANRTEPTHKAQKNTAQSHTKLPNSRFSLTNTVINTICSRSILHVLHVKQCLNSLQSIYYECSVMQ